MLKTEVASLMNEQGRMFDWATKVSKQLNLNSEDKEISQVVDAWAKQIGEKGADPNNEIAEYMVRILNPQIYDVPDELLDAMFNRGTIGEFDDYQTNEVVRNTLIAHEAAKGANVDKSYLDVTSVKPVWKHRQVETELRYSDLRKNGFKTIANMTTFAEEALKNKMFFDIFSVVDTLITAPSAQGIVAGGTNPTVASMDELALYLTDRDDNPFTVSLSKYAQAVGRMPNFSEYLSEDMKNEYNRYGRLGLYSGVRIRSISGAHKTGDGQLLLPDKRVFGIAGKIGDLDMRGNIRIYETLDNNKEVVQLKITGHEYGIQITELDKVAKIVLA